MKFSPSPENASGEHTRKRQGDTRGSFRGTHEEASGEHNTATLQTQTAAGTSILKKMIIINKKRIK